MFRKSGFFFSLLALWLAGVQPTTYPDVVTTITCERGTTKQLSCPTGKTIKINNAYYGRTSLNVCQGYTGMPLDCVACSSHDIIRTQCNGLQSCTINASNTIFGDPCFGYKKYVETEHICV